MAYLYAKTSETGTVLLALMYLRVAASLANSKRFVSFDLIAPHIESLAVARPKQVTRLVRDMACQTDCKRDKSIPTRGIRCRSAPEGYVWTVDLPVRPVTQITLHGLKSAAS